MGHSNKQNGTMSQNRGLAQTMAQNILSMSMALNILPMAMTVNILSMSMELNILPLDMSMTLNDSCHDFRV